MSSRDEDVRADIPALLSVTAQRQNRGHYAPLCRQQWGWRGGEEPALSPSQVTEFLRTYAWLNETELALQCLFEGNFDVPRSVEILHAARREKLRLQRDQEDRIRASAFAVAMGRHSKKFHLVKRKLGRQVTTREVVSKFYLWKHTPAAASWRERQQAKKKREAARLERLRSKDYHKEFCGACFKGGKLLCCDGCERAYHLQCVQPPMTEVPKGDWFCAHCQETPAPVDTDEEQYQKVGAPTPSGPDSSTELETISNGSSSEAGSELFVTSDSCDATGGAKSSTERRASGKLTTGSDPDGVCIQPGTESSGRSEVVAESTTDVDDSDEGASGALLSRRKAEFLTQQAKFVTRVGESRYSSSSRSLEYLSSPGHQRATKLKLTPLRLEAAAFSRKRKRQIVARRSFQPLQDE